MWSNEELGASVERTSMPQEILLLCSVCFLHEVCGIESCKSQCTRIAELEEAPGPIRGRINSSVLFLFLKLQQELLLLLALCVVIGSLKSIYREVGAEALSHGAVWVC